MNCFIPRILQYHIRLFSIIGYCGVSLSENLKQSVIIERCLLLWSFLLLLAFNILAFLALFSSEAFLFTGDKFGYFNDTLKVVVADIAVTVSYLETIFKRPNIKRFWKIFDCLQRMTFQGEDLVFRSELWANRRFLITFYIIVLLETSVLILFVLFQNMTRHLILFWSLFTPFIFVVHLRNMQFVFYVEVLRLELEKLKKDLSLIVKYTRSATYGCDTNELEEFVHKKLLDKQKHYCLIYEMFEEFQNSFGFSMIAVLLMIYVRVLVDVYFSYYTFYRDWNKAEIILLIPACLQIPTFLITSKNCMDVIKFITFNLHNIITHFNNQTGIISSQLQNFSLQILHQRISINGIGITRMDGYMLTRAIGSVTTYMIFFIQFMPKFTNIQDMKTE